MSDVWSSLGTTERLDEPLYNRERRETQSAGIRDEGLTLVAAPEADEHKAEVVEHARSSRVRQQAMPRLSWKLLSDVDMRSIEFRDKPLLQADAFHLICGRKGMGKGTFLANVAARVTRGELGAKTCVIWIGSEDSAAVDIKPRIVAAGGDPARVFVIDDGWVQLPRDIEEIEETIRSLGTVGMVVIDPVGNHIAGKNSNGETEIRDAIAPLNRLADEFETMVFGVRHLSEKDCSNGILAAILGSSAWVQVPRAVLAVVRDDEDEDITHVQCVAGNRVRAGASGRMFRIEGVLLDGLEEEVTRAVWIGGSNKDVESMLTAGSGRAVNRSADARDLLLNVTEAEPAGVESDVLDARIAQETGLAAKTIQNLRGQLGKEGLLRAIPEKDDDGQVRRWVVVRTNAPRPERAASDEQLGTRDLETRQIPTAPKVVADSAQPSADVATSRHGTNRDLDAEDASPSSARSRDPESSEVPGSDPLVLPEDAAEWEKDWHRRRAS